MADLLPKTTPASLRDLAVQAREASRVLGSSTGEIRDRALKAAAAALEEARDEILAANQKDLQAARASGTAEAMLARLTLGPEKLSRVIQGVRNISALPDPVGRVEILSQRPNGLLLQRMSVPLGLIGMIYEARPEVTVDAAALCLKSGNAVLLRGGSEAFHSNRALLEPMRRGLASAGLPVEALAMPASTDRELIREMVRLDGIVDVVIPRGGEALVRYVRENATVPAIYHAKGVCHIYVDAGADLDMAERIALNAKISAPAVCNAMETLLVHEAEAAAFLPRMASAFAKEGVLMHGDEAVRRILPGIIPVTEEELSSEYLRKEVSLVLVRDLDAALEHIARYGSSHTEAIISKDASRAERFLREVNSSSVMWNASTRFADGGEYGLGAEIGISTQKLPPRGPVGVEGLTSWKYVVRGSGQVR